MYCSEIILDALLFMLNNTSLKIPIDRSVAHLIMLLLVPFMLKLFDHSSYYDSLKVLEKSMFASYLLPKRRNIDNQGVFKHSQPLK